jgi:hypothetical protein
MLKIGSIGRILEVRVWERLLYCVEKQRVEDLLVRSLSDGLEKTSTAI